jgi:hypothetical protein
LILQWADAEKCAIWRLHLPVPMSLPASAARFRFFLFPVHITPHPFEKKDQAGADDDERNEGFETGHD